MGTIADKLAKLNSTKAALKSAINGSGSTVGDVFSAYPTAITSGKSAIAQAITDKGVTTAANATFQQMAANIGQIESGGGYVIGSGLKLDKETNTLSVDTADQVEADNSKPITSAAVFVTVGNIESLLETI